MKKKSIFLGLFVSLISGYLIAFLQYSGLVTDNIRVKNDIEMKQDHRRTQVVKKNNSSLASPTRLLLPIFIEESLLQHGITAENLSKKDWDHFLEYSAYEELSKVSSLELLVFFSLISENQTMLRFALAKGAEIDARLFIEQYTTPLKYASLYSDMTLFKMVVDACLDLNTEEYSSLISQIHRSSQPDHVKRAKFEYLISSGYEIKDILKEVVPLSSYGSLSDDFLLNIDLTNINPNEVLGRNIMLTRLINRGASDDVVVPLVYQLTQDIEINQKNKLLWSALRSNSIKNAETIQAILDVGVDPNMKSQDNDFSFAGYTLMQSIVTRDLENYDIYKRKLRVLIANGARIMGQFDSKEVFLERLNSQKEMSKERYNELLSIIESN